jgi:uncharacterized protein YcaQ
LVLQSRIAKYQARLLQELLYQDRKLWDGWDKKMSIFSITDWTNFSYPRAQREARYHNPDDPSFGAAPQILKTIEENGPQSSIDFKDSERIEWWWGTQASLAKTTLDILFLTGKVGIHHKVGTRRVFDLVERLIPDHLLSEPDPHPSEDDYQNWHVLRRVAGLGLAHSGPSDYWGGILGVTRINQRAEILNRLAEKGLVIPIQIQELEGRTFYIRNNDLDLLDRTRRKSRARQQAAFIAPLDNLLWDRKLVRWIFDFDYVWEVYKPVAQRKFGYYVLPILYGDRFIGRFEPVFDRKAGELLLKGWWWEEDVFVTDEMVSALKQCLTTFLSFVGAKRIRIAEGVHLGKELDRVLSLSLK